MKKEKISFHGAGRLREERERLGFSQQDAESIFGISRVTWGKYERGDTAPGADVLTELAKMGANVMYIITGERTPMRVAERDVKPYTPAERVSEEIRTLKLTDEDAEMVMAVAKRLSVLKG